MIFLVFVPLIGFWLFFSVVVRKGNYVGGMLSWQEWARKATLAAIEWSKAMVRIGEAARAGVISITTLRDKILLAYAEDTDVD